MKKFYGEPSTLDLCHRQGGDQVVIRLSSSEGVHQEDPLGPALFCAAIHPSLCAVSHRWGNVTVLAYLDDVYLVGPTTSLEGVLDHLKSSLSKAGLVICDQKCELYSPSSTNGNFSIPVSSDGATILGTPMGTSAFVQSKCVEIAETGEHLLSEIVNLIVNLKDRQCSMLILRHCHVPRLTYLARQVPRQDLAKAANIHDNMPRSSFANIISLPHLDDIK